MGSGVTQCQGQRHTSASQYLWAGLVRMVRHSTWKTQGTFPVCEEGCLVAAVGDSPKPAFLSNIRQKQPAENCGSGWWAATREMGGKCWGTTAEGLVLKSGYVPGRSGAVSIEGTPSGDWGRQLMRGAASTEGTPSGT